MRSSVHSAPPFLWAEGSSFFRHRRWFQLAAKSSGTILYPLEAQPAQECTEKGFLIPSSKNFILNRSQEARGPRFLRGEGHARTLSDTVERPSHPVNADE